MRAKKAFIAAGIIIVLLAVGLIPFNNESSAVVKAPLYDVAKQVNDLNNWKKWDTVLKAANAAVTGSMAVDQTAVAGGYTYRLHHLSPIAVSLTKTGETGPVTSLIKIVPLTGTTTAITSEERTTIFGYIKQGISGNKGGASAFTSFKAWMEDVNNRYGFPIQVVPVKDTLILTARAAITGTAGYTTASLYRLLYAFIQQHQLPFEKNYFYKTVLDSKEIAVGIPVYTPVKDTANIHCLQLPRKGRLIEGSYTGRLVNTQSIYTAITNFILNQHLKQVAQPMEQYNVSDTAAGTNSHVTMKIYYPIF